MGCCPASFTAQAFSVLGWLDPGMHLGHLAYSIIPGQRDTPKRLGFWSFLHRHRRYVHHPDAFVQCFQGKPADLYLVSLPDDEPNFPRCPTLGHPLICHCCVIIVWFNRHTMFKRGTGTTEVLMPEKSSNLTPETGELEVNSLSASVG